MAQTRCRVSYLPEMSEATSTMAGRDDESGAAGGDPGILLVHANEALAMPRGLALTGRSHALGREPPPGGLALRDAAASRIHAVIHCDRDEVRIKDAGSRNGTYVCGERVTDSVLHDQDDVRIGDSVFVFVAHHATEHLAYGLDGSVAPHARSVSIPDVVGGLSMARVSALVEAAATSDAVSLVLGETGVGKELVAHGIHAASRRAGPFVALNCAAISPHLVESELFGHERGAFTSADRRHEGLVRSASGGTLFLDEIGDLGLEAQAKLLRVLETKEVLAVGATRATPVDLRVVCATHQDLPRLVREHHFRVDLFARISGYTIRIPALRERKEDLPLLVRCMLARAGAPDAPVSFDFMHRVVRHAWSMNVRELRGAVQRAVSLSRGGELKGTHLPEEVDSHVMPEVPQARKKSPSREEIVALMHQHGGNVSAVARALSRDAAQIYRWLKRYGVDPTGFR